jgi:hypothetical protein
MSEAPADPPRVSTYIVAFRGEHLIFMPELDSDEVGLPYVTHFSDVPADEVKQELARWLGSRGSCVWFREVRTFETGLGVANVYTCNFYGYYPQGWVAMKPSELPENLVPHHLPFIQAVVAWRKAKEEEQTRLEKELDLAIDLKPRRR